MSKVQKICMKAAIKTGNKKLAVKLALIQNIERGNGVHLDNAYADISEFVTAKEFAGYLGALTVEGFYEAETDPVYKGKFGYVKQVKA